VLYRPDVDEVVARYRQYWEGRMPDRLLAMVSLTDEDITRPWGEWPDYERAWEEFDRLFRRRVPIRDDSIPAALPGLGMGPWGGMFGAEVKLQPMVSASKPFPSLEALRNLGFDRDSYWVRRQLEAVEYFCQRSRGRFAVAPPETPSGVNFLYGLRGVDVFIDLLEQPELCLQIIDWLRPICIWLVEQFKALTGSYQDGVFDHWQVWLPGNPVWLSVDMNCQCSPEFYDRFGFQDTQAFIDRFGGGFLHLHKPTGTYLLPKLVKHTRMMGIEFLHDLGFLETCFEGLEEIRRIVPGGIHIDCDFRQFTERLQARTLPAGIIYHVKNCPGVDEANRLMSAVRDYRAEDDSERAKGQGPGNRSASR
jgi:hypothetical protein